MTTETTGDQPDNDIVLSKRTREVFEFVRQNIGFYGPTVREIAAAMSIKSPNGVVYHLNVLEKRGLIKRHPGIARGIEVIHGS